MGYYDDHTQGRYREQRGNRGGAFLAGLLGAIIGAIIVILAIPTLSKQGVLPYKLATNQNQTAETSNNNNQQNVVKKVSYDVSTNTTKAVEKTGAAVVGINNIQSTSFWSDNDDSSEEAAGT